jgi:hypothetical protein
LAGDARLCDFGKFPENVIQLAYFPNGQPALIDEPVPVFGAPFTVTKNGKQFCKSTGTSDKKAA